MSEAPPVRRRLLGAALRRYRESVGYGLDDAARILECDRSKISRIETGQRGIRPKELRELLAEYGVEEKERLALAAIARHNDRRGWWQSYEHVPARLQTQRSGRFFRGCCGKNDPTLQQISAVWGPRCRKTGNSFRAARSVAYDGGIVTVIVAKGARGGVLRPPTRTI